MTTYAAFVTAISDLTITGVTRLEDTTPESIGAADLPFQFVRLPSGDFADAPVTCTEVGTTKTIDLVVCVQSSGLGLADLNYEDTVTMMDYVETALIAWDAAVAQNGVLVEYSITAGDEEVGDVSFWSVVATVTIKG